MDLKESSVLTWGGMSFSRCQIWGVIPLCSIVVPRVRRDKNGRRICVKIGHQAIPLKQSSCEEEYVSIHLRISVRPLQA